MEKVKPEKDRQKLSLSHPFALLALGLRVGTKERGQNRLLSDREKGQSPGTYSIHESGEDSEPANEIKVKHVTCTRTSCSSYRTVVSVTNTKQYILCERVHKIAVRF